MIVASDVVLFFQPLPLVFLDREQVEAWSLIFPGQTPMFQENLVNLQPVLVEDLFLQLNP